MPEKKDDEIPKKNDDEVPENKDDEIPKKNEDEVPENKDDEIPKKNEDEVPEKNDEPEDDIPEDIDINSFPKITPKFTRRNVIPDKPPREEREEEKDHPKPEIHDEKDDDEPSKPQHKIIPPPEEDEDLDISDIPALKPHTPKFRVKKVSGGEPFHRPKKIDETPEDVEETPKKIDETPKKIDETPEDVEETPKKIDETPEDVEETPKKIDETPEDVDEAPEVPEEDLELPPLRTATFRKRKVIDVRPKPAEDPSEDPFDHFDPYDPETPGFFDLEPVEIIQHPVPESILPALPTFKPFVKETPKEEEPEGPESDLPELGSDEFPDFPAPIFHVVPDEESEEDDGGRGGTIFALQNLRKLATESELTEEEKLEKMLRNFALLPPCIQAAISVCRPEARATTPEISYSELENYLSARHFAHKCSSDEELFEGHCTKKCPPGFKDLQLFCLRPDYRRRDARRDASDDPSLYEWFGDTQVKRCTAPFSVAAGPAYCRFECPLGWKTHGRLCQKPRRFRGQPLLRTQEVSSQQ